MRCKLATFVAATLLLLTANTFAHADTIYKFQWSYVLFGLYPQTVSWELTGSPTSVSPSSVEYDNVPTGLDVVPTFFGTAGVYANNFSIGWDYSDDYTVLYRGGTTPSLIDSTSPEVRFKIGTYGASGSITNYYPDYSTYTLIDGLLTISKEEVPSPVPEPPSLMLLGTALLGSALYWYRGKLRKSQFIKSAN